MRKIFYTGKELGRVIGKNHSNIRTLKKELKIDINIDKQGNIELKSTTSDPIIEYIALKVLEALSLGFDLETSLYLRNEDYILITLNIKDFVKSQRVEKIKGIVIGTEGKTKRVVEQLTESDIKVSDHTVAIIGKTEHAELASAAIKSLLRGAKQANIYTYLEKNRARLKALAQEDIEEYIKK